MIQKIMPSTKVLTKTYTRKTLQKSSLLQNLNTRLIRSENFAHDMVIPGGMTQKEEFVYKLTGKFPKSVTDRWYETHDYNINQHLSGDDETVRVSSQILHDTGYTTDSGAHYSGIDSSDDEGCISRIIGHLFDEL